MKLASYVSACMGAGALSNLAREVRLIRRNQIIAAIDGDGDQVYSAKVRFRDPDVREDVIVSAMRARPAPYQLYDNVKVMHDPDQRQVIGIANFVERFLLSYLVLAIGASVLIFTLGLRFNNTIFDWLRQP